MTIRRIDPFSAFKVGLAVNGFVGFILGVFCTLMTVTGMAFVRQSHVSLFGVLAGTHIGLFAIILCPILYGLVGSVIAVIGALLYNVASAWIGGLEIDMT